MPKNDSPQVSLDQVYRVLGKMAFWAGLENLELEGKIAELERANQQLTARLLEVEARKSPGGVDPLTGKG